ncbi:MAG: hypothetical protein ACJKTH_00750 [Patescibacteria group bacterium UBA2163]
MNTEDKISLNDEEFKEFYESFGSSNFRLQSEIFGDLGTKQLDVYFKSIGFATTVIGVIGLIAGFGFTALDFVKTMSLFMAGEVLLLGGLFYGLWWVQQKYQAEFNDIEAERKKYSDFYNTRNEKFLILYNNWLETKKISKQDFINLNETDKKSINLFKNDSDRKAPQIYSQIVYILMILGTFSLLGSLVCF